ncbi:MAG: Asp-tRNA(Asn)/Glu-tRNA(Gln) amidotransferase subunit GatA [Desulfobulbaceae bacterium]|nr:Asp-tRNA(Asn)/Glu-tRNA(Gln) amidotransferase subunit GatA [Desulfobulbaceae bacterium]MCK5322763.1 Asp-tRNA(Asn)/Glu-tRNA(Gln) amidotransferase subunit GatA [Desulfobulbaceae bacterium]MCK5544864.1 Asp-tRNA(Asn)/Glu-tRNA(Gln) amidotransferase subunit GatA [Desulfobulbaceae bacterium]
MELYSLSIHELKDILAKRKASAVEVTHSVLDRIDKVEDKINAYITVDRNNALKQAEEADRLLNENNGGPLCGIPISLKDVLCTRGMRTTAGSSILESFIPPYSATVVEKLEKAGAVIVGKVAMDEFAMGSSSENCAYGIPKNPWNPDYICGGSSGGSAASVAACECIASLGSDTGGSVRQPASHCGVVGMKPTYGRVSRFGLIAFASSLDQIGPLTRNVTDCAHVMNVICGYDNRDSTSVNRSTPDYLSELSGGLKGMKIGIPKEYFVEGLDPEVEHAVGEGINALKKAGAETVEVSLPHTDYGVAAYYIIAPAEASSNLARYDGVKYGFRDKDAKSLIEMYEKTRSKGFGTEVKRRIIIGTYALSSGYYDAYYKKASQVRTLIIKDFHEAFQTCDIIASPVTPTPAWRIGEMSDDPLGMYLSDILTISANLAGIPGISVPCGVSKGGLPIGIQLQASHFEEEKLLKAAYNFEQRMELPDIPEI